MIPVSMIESLHEIDGNLSRILSTLETAARKELEVCDETGPGQVLDNHHPEFAVVTRALQEINTILVTVLRTLREVCEVEPPDGDVRPKPN